MSYTAILTVYYLMLKGWGITLQKFNLNRKLKMMVIMTVTFMLYFLFFAANTGQWLRKMMSVIVALWYLVLMVVYYWNFHSVDSLIKQSMDASGAFEKSQRSLSFDTKKGMLKWNFISALCFCSTQFLQFLVFNFLQKRAMWRALAGMQTIEIALLLVVFALMRPRKAWPKHFKQNL